MNRMLSYILVGGASALVGAVSGYIFCKRELRHRFDKELENAINEELSAIRKRNEDRTTPNEDHNIPICVPHVKEDFLEYAKNLIRDEFPGEELNEYRVQTVSAAIASWMEEGITEDEATNRLNELMASFEGPEDDEDPDVDEDEIEDEDPQSVMEEYMHKPPEIVSEYDYRRLPPYFEFVTFHYYEEDDVLTDDKGMVVEDVDGIVGDALTRFGQEAAEMNDGDDDAVYVVNGDWGLAIEIERIHSSYEAWLGG